MAYLITTFKIIIFIIIMLVNTILNINIGVTSVKHFGKKYEIIQSSTSGEFYIIYFTTRTIRQIPHRETLKELNIDIKSLRNVSDSYIKNYNLQNPIPLLKKTEVNPDELLRIIVQKSIILQPPIYWIDSYYLPNIFNPSIALWNGHILMCWRSASVRGVQKSFLKFGWLNSTSFQLNSSLSYLGIGSSTKVSVSTKDNYNILQDDPRLLVLNDNNLLVTYASVFEKLNRYSSLLININKNGLAHLYNSTQLIHKETGIAQKNWVPFEYNNTLLYMQTINPLHIVSVGNKVDIDTNITTTMYKLDEVKLPWPEEFGKLRGGTPAILIKDVYLSFFHSKGYCQKPFKYGTYLIGAITFCPHPPFNIHSISYQPIVNDSFYGYGIPWLWPSLDFAVYPSGIIATSDHNNNSKSNSNYVYVSIGHQDKNAFIVKFKVSSLLKSLEIVSNCSTT